MNKQPSKLLIIGLITLLVIPITLTVYGSTHESVVATSCEKRDGKSFIVATESNSETICLYTDDNDDYKVIDGDVRLATGTNGLPIYIYGLHGWEGHKRVWVRVLETDNASGPDYMGYEKIKSGYLKNGINFIIHPGKHELDAKAEVEVKVDNEPDLMPPSATLNFDVHLQWW